MSTIALSSPPPTYEVMVVGHGFMGTNHRKKVEALQTDGRTHLACIVDVIDSCDTVPDTPFFHTVEDGFKSVVPDVVSICTSSKTHFAILKTVLELSKTYNKYPHILMEKPFVANGIQAQSVSQLLKDYPGKISGGYLFRQSPIVADAVEHMQKHELSIKKVSTVWQKDRMQKGPLRPSEGVHIDEATHAVDLIINCILPQLGVSTDTVTILDSSFKQQSEVGQIVDQKKQDELYQDEPEKLNPIAEVTYSLDVGSIPVSGFSSFKMAPQRREIEIEHTNGTTLLFEFDVDGFDRLHLVNSSNQRTLISEYKCDKLMFEWEAFLDYCSTGKESYQTQTFRDMEFDIHFTEALGKKLAHPYVIKH